ncbi:MAG: amidophosphoribosyltransferase [Desulfuromonas sp.]|uniref:ComF family protein n=1 Tax=Desulfuromonas sp. TaxID=892 RepID=UPI000CBF5011|nr:ComF family protein [Desulfuromonas sp.]PLX84929.1 MAG: amidophosphoribosyltransferase [Desulfuromonas sp.]
MRSAASLLHALRAECSGLLDLLLPPACPLCGRQLQSGGPAAPFCSACQKGIHPLVSPSCPRCALPFTSDAGSDHHCEACIRKPPPFAWVRAAGLYEDSLRRAVQRFKYEGAIYLDRALSHLLAQALQGDRERFCPDLLVPVPLHRSRLRQRTFNQALLLARALGRRWDVPAAADLLERTRPTPAQQGLDARQRRRNLKGAFALRRPLAGRRILLIDDVMTTGATARECSAVLLKGGADAVGVAVLGRARRHLQ